MKISILLFIILFATIGLMVAGTIDQVTPAVVFLRCTLPITEDVNGVPYQVVLVNPTNHPPVVQKTYSITGTGFIIQDTNSLCYLVTAKHVAVNMGPDCEVIMGGDNEEPLKFTLSELTDHQAGLKWYFDDIADIAIHPLPIMTPNVLKAFTNRAIPLLFLANETNLPSRDVTLTELGFPLALGADGQFLPLAKDTKVTSGMLHDANGYYFLLQDPSVNGYSGGPLIESGDPRLVANASTFTTVTGGAHCWGFIQGNYSDETGGKMCRIVPAFYAFQLIQKAKKDFQIITVFPPALNNSKTN